MSTKAQYPGGWFGASWDAPVCDEKTHRDTPVDKSCAECFDPIGPHDQGMLIPYLTTTVADTVERENTLEAFHLECFLRNVLGPNDWVAKICAVCETAEEQVED